MKAQKGNLHQQPPNLKTILNRLAPECKFVVP